MKNETDNVIEYKRPDQKDRFEVVFMISIEVEANDKEHARQMAKDEFEFSDLDYAETLVKPLNNEAAE
ncbi:hypothetical protein CRP212_gp59 [Roseobacter phage CRP-212]|nr:hypothetical protein CRP212_gp59 [Roseobacter phage CRP-212]